jgi:hypothetical protein
MVAPTSGQWLFILGMSLVAVAIVQTLKQINLLDPRKLFQR